MSYPYNEQVAGGKIKSAEWANYVAKKLGRVSNVGLFPAQITSYHIFGYNSIYYVLNYKPGSTTGEIISAYTNADIKTTFQSLINGLSGPARISMARATFTFTGKVTIPDTLDGLFLDLEPGTVLKKAAGFTDSYLIERLIAAGHAYSVLSTESGYFDSYSHLTIDGNKALCSANSSGFGLIGDSGNVAACITFLNPRFLQNYAYGMYLEKANGVYLFGGDVRHNRLHGIRHVAGAADVFMGVNIEANGVGAGAGYTGLSLESASYDNRVIGCDFGLNASNAGAGDTGYQIMETAGCASNKILGCKLQSNIVPLKPYSLAGTGTILRDCVGTNGQKIVWYGGHAYDAIAAITPGASPYTYTNADNYPEQVQVLGGTVSAIAFVRDTVETDLGLTSGVLMLEPGDAVKVTYSVAPTMRKIQR